MKTDKEITTWVTKEMKRMTKELNKEKARCKKEYLDWEDNEFNMLDSKFIWGYNVDPNKTPSFLSWDDAYVYFDRKSKKYYMIVDTGFYTKRFELDTSEEAARAEIDRLFQISDAFRDFLIENNLRQRADFNCFQDNFLCADSLTELYTKFRIQIEGYKWYKQGQN